MITIRLFCVNIFSKEVFYLETLGDRIKSIRLRRGLNKTEFGKLFTTTGSLVNKWESNDVTPSEARLKDIAKSENITVDELLHGNSDVNKSLDAHQFDNLISYVDRKREVFKQEIKLLTPGALSGLLTLGMGFKESRKKAIEDYETHRERIKTLEKFGQDYIESNYDNYTYDKFLEDFPDSNSNDFEVYKDREWLIFQEILESFWNLTDSTNDNYSLINKGFTDQIANELNKVRKIAVEEDKEEYYVEKIIQPFLDQAAKDFKEYIKDYIDTED